MKLLITLVLTLALTSCTALPAEERAFAVVLGISGGETWQVYARIPTYQSGGGYTTVSGSGDTLQAALRDCDDHAPMHLHLSQLRMAVLTKATPIFETLAVLAERSDLRMQSALAIYDGDQSLAGSLAALMDKMEPATGSRLSKSLDVLRETRIAQGVAPDTTVGDVLRLGQRQTALVARVTAEDGIDLNGAWALNESDQSLAGGRSPAGNQSPAGGHPAVLLDRDDMRRMTAMLKGKLTLHGTDAVLRLKNRSDADAALALLIRLSEAQCDPLGVKRHALRQGADGAWSIRSVRWTVRSPK